MPRISAFYGIVIFVYRADHPPPHFHAQYGDDWAQMSISTGRVLEGLLPPRALRLVREWARLHRDELQANWDHAQGDQPLAAIPPLP